MTKQWSAAIILMGVLLAGCGANHGELGNRSLYEAQPYNVMKDANGNQIMNKRFAVDQMNEMNRKDGRRLNSNNIVGKHDNYRMEMNETIGQALVDKFGFSAAHVVLTDQNAYVAVAADGESGRYTSKSRALGRTQASYMNPLIAGGGAGGSKGTERQDSRFNLRTDGMYDARNNGIYDPRPNADGGRPNGNGGGMYTATGMEDNLTDKQKADIAAEVKRMKPSVAHVYISAKSDFVERLAAYAADERSGQAIQGYVAEFNALAERIFPYESGSGQYSAKGNTAQKRTSYIYD